MKNERNVVVVVFLAQCVLVGVGLAATGLLAPHLTPDSSSYLDFPFDSPASILRGQRTPGYPVFLETLNLLGGAERLAAIAQWCVHATAVGVFAVGLHCIWRTHWGCMFVASGMLYANVVYRYVNNVTPDLIAVSTAIATIGALIRWTKTSSRTDLIWIALGVVACCLLRPAYLFMIVLIPLLGYFLQRLHQVDATRRRATLSLLVASVAPIVAYCAIRWMLVGYLGLVSFGGNNFAGVMCAFMGPETTERLPDGVREYGAEVYQRRLAYAAANPEFPLGRTTSYTEIEAQFDDSTWRICVPAALAACDEDWPAANQAMMRLAVGVIRAHPRYYAMWLAKAARRAALLIAAEFAGNPVHLLLLTVLLGAQAYYVALRLRAPSHIATTASEEFQVANTLLLIAVLFAVGKVSIVILTSPPLGRFMDAAAVFLVTVLAFAVWNRLTAVQRLRQALH